MTRLRSHTEQVASDLAHRHGFSMDAVRHMIYAVDAGWGGMAAFDHPEFGGPGQWMQGGMIMLSEPLNHSLRARVDALCNEIADIHQADGPLSDDSPQPGAPWPEYLGTPNASGSQGYLHYAWFANQRRLALMRHGQLQLLDTGDHRISGVSQQQSHGHDNIQFTSQYGTIDLASLTPVDDSTTKVDEDGTGSPSSLSRPAGDDILAAIERLGELRERGLLTEDEFNAKKTELLSRL